MIESEDTRVDAQIAQWRGYLERRRAVVTADVDELEDHLRHQVADLRRVGLSGEEAFLVAVRRMGGQDELSREFAREHSDRLWKQLVVAPEGPDAGGALPRELLVALGFALAAAVAVKLPEAFGVRLADSPEVYARNLPLFAWPFVAGFLGWKRRLAGGVIGALAASFVVAALVVNLYPFDVGGATWAITALHLPIALWFAVGVAYVGGEWRPGPRRMDFVRFTGEWLIYYALIALGGGVLVGLTAAAFGALGVEVDDVLGLWVVPVGAVGATVVAAYLVEAKQSVIENMAPVLTRVFTPLAAAMLVVLVVVMAVSGLGPDAERELLIVSDLLLVLVLGLLLYSWSARDAAAPPGAFDWLQLVLVVAALVVDAFGLAAMGSRISSFGPSPNKVAALGMNLVLLVNLAWSAWLLVGFLRRKVPFAALERWQTDYLPVFGAWAAVVVVAIGPLFSFACGRRGSAHAGGPSGGHPDRLLPVRMTGQSGGRGGGCEIG